jgi:pimeloyl-ACP methyl ester carboxylesterase
MAGPLIVLVHGGQHTRACWNPTVEAIHRTQADAQVLAVNLPGHGDEPGELATLTIAQCVESVTAKIRALNPAQVILVGHSMAGITIPGVAAKLGQDQLRRVIFLACCIPPQGERVVDTLQVPMNIVALRAVRKTAVASPLPSWLASWVFANGMTRQQKAFMHSCLCSESTGVTVEAVDRSDFPYAALTWIIPLRDRAMRPKLQRALIKNLNRHVEILELDSCHDAMISEPEKLAAMILKYY